MPNNTFKTIHDIDKAIVRQKAKAKLLEQKMDQQFEHLQENYGSMVKNSLFKINIGGESIVGNLLQNILGNERVQRSVGSVLGKAGDRFADWMDKFTDKLSKKEEK
jgi:site-specific recombinase